jgi:hypothetical protein
MKQFLLLIIVGAIFLYLAFNSYILVGRDTEKAIIRERQSCDSMSRDYFRYNCSKIKRIGGEPNLLKRLPNEIMRTEGAYFVCFDQGAEPIKDNCNVISIGINMDPSFDVTLNKDYGCRIESFDPFVEDGMFYNIRKTTNQLNKVSVKVNDKWTFHRIGLCGPKSITNEKKIGMMTTLDKMIEYTGLKNQIIDILKIDIENAEWEPIRTFDMDYLCKYVKQFLIETHFKDWKIFPGMAMEHRKILRRLEKCFRLFVRHTRFYQEISEKFYHNGFLKTEFQDPITY